MSTVIHDYCGNDFPCVTKKIIKNLTSNLKSYFRENEKAATPVLQDIYRLPRCRRIRPLRLLRRVQISGGDVKFILWSSLLGTRFKEVRPILAAYTATTSLVAQSMSYRQRHTLTLCNWTQFCVLAWHLPCIGIISSPWVYI